VILWAAVLLKKRVLVLADSREQLQDVLSAIPALAWHRCASNSQRLEHHSRRSL
jgi:hypothetical protein